jgi:hypothetical protein
LHEIVSKLSDLSILGNVAIPQTLLEMRRLSPGLDAVTAAAQSAARPKRGRVAVRTAVGLDDRSRLADGLVMPIESGMGIGRLLSAICDWPGSRPAVPARM